MANFEDNIDDMLRKVKKQIIERAKKDKGRGRPTRGEIKAEKLGEFLVNNTTGEISMMGDDDDDREVINGISIADLDVDDMTEKIDNENEEWRKKNKLERSIPAKQEWIERQAVITKLADDIKKDMKKIQDIYKRTAKAMKKTTVMKEGLWAEIKTELEAYDNTLYWNEKNKEVEIYENPDDKPKPKAVKSPFTKL